MIIEETAFVGRDAELAQASRLLETVRLITLVGPGGVGKTRLAQRVAAAAGPGFEDGVVVIELDTLTDPAQLPLAVAAEFGLRDMPAEPVAQLLAFLGTKSMLIVLDNCEHMAQACRELVTAVLRAAPAVRILATSRHVLGVGGEQLLPVHPLSVCGDAVTLFTQRAARALPHFAVTDDNIDTIRRICCRLDGIPLAIELVVPWLRVMSVEDVLRRLDDTFTLLTAEAATRPYRQQTLIAAVDWSYALCSPDEQALWARVSVFTGGFTVDAAAAVCTDERLPASTLLRLLGGLVDKSVLVRDDVDGTSRLRMLYTIRRYGRQLLRRSGDERQYRRRHLDYFLDFAEHNAQAWLGPDQLELAARTRREHSNLRAALNFGIGDGVKKFAGARLAIALRYYWHGCGFLGEGRGWLDRVLELDNLPAAIRCEALAVNSTAATLLGELKPGSRLAEEATRIAREAGDPMLMASALLALAKAALAGGDHTLGEASCRQAVALFADVVTDQTILAYASWAMNAVFGGHHARAMSVAEKAIELADAHGEQQAKSNALQALALAAWRLASPAEAVRHATAGIRIKARFNDLIGLSMLVELLAWIAGSVGSARSAAELLGVAGTVWQRTGSELVHVSETWQAPRRHCQQQARMELGEERYHLAYAKGAGIGADLGDAVDHVLTVADTLAAPAPAVTAALTSREIEVAELAAAGASNKEIAARLVISTRTAEKHLANISRKLGLTSRSQLAARLRHHP